MPSATVKTEPDQPIPPTQLVDPRVTPFARTMTNFATIVPEPYGGDRTTNSTVDHIDHIRSTPREGLIKLSRHRSRTLHYESNIDKYQWPGGVVMPKKTCTEYLAKTFRHRRGSTAPNELTLIYIACGFQRANTQYAIEFLSVVTLYKSRFATACNTLTSED